jgi:hypothetical protein
MIATHWQVSLVTCAFQYLIFLSPVAANRARRSHCVTQVREMANAAWDELEQLRIWNNTGLGEGGLIEVLP